MPNSQAIVACLLAFFAQPSVYSFDKSLLYSPFNCGQSQWELDFNDTELSAQNLNDWLLHWQFDCNSGREINGKFASVGGLGSSFMFGSKYFMDAIEMKQIFRPLHSGTYWTWAAENPANCTLKIRTYDCFSEPMSDCGVSYIRSEKLQTQLSQSIARMEDNPLRHITETLTDICTFGRVLKKPVKWVHGQLMQYMMRPSAEVMTIVQQRVDNMFSGLPTGPKFVTIGMQIRSGTLDNNRQPMRNISEILHIIDNKVKLVKELYNETVTMVFLCGDIPEETFRSGAFMNEHHPRSFTFRTSHLVSFGKEDVEASLKNGYNPHQATRFDLFTDFITDIEILSTVDYLIGSNSNVYTVAALFRAARQQHHRPENTCFVDRNEAPDLRLLCEGTVHAHKLWNFYFNPHYTIFEPYPMHTPRWVNITETRTRGRNLRVSKRN